MISISEAAAEAIREIIESVPEAEGLRLETRPASSDNGTGPTTVIDVVAATEPEEEDEVVEQHGVQVFVEAPLADVLDGKQLDYEGGEAGFTVVDPE